MYNGPLSILVGVVLSAATKIATTPTAVPDVHVKTLPLFIDACVQYTQPANEPLQTLRQHLQSTDTNILIVKHVARGDKIINDESTTEKVCTVRYRIS